MLFHFILKQMCFVSAKTMIKTKKWVCSQRTDRYTMQNLSVLNLGFCMVFLAKHISPPPPPAPPTSSEPHTELASVKKKPKNICFHSAAKGDQKILKKNRGCT